MARKVRLTLEPNITRDDFGIEVAVRVAGLPRRRHRWPLDVWKSDAGRDRVRAWRDAARTELDAELRAFGPVLSRTTRGSLEEAVLDFLPRLNVREGLKADISHVRAWLPVTLPAPHDPRPLGQWARAAITTAVVDAVIRQWQTAPSAAAIRKVRVSSYGRAKKGAPGVAGAGVTSHERSIPATSGHVVAARTIRHRCRMLGDLFHTLDGPKAPTPVDDAKVPAVPKTLPQRIPEDVLRAVLTKLRTLDPVTFVQYAVVSTTWQRPIAVSRAQPEDIDLEARIWIVRNQKGAPAHTIELGPDAVAAWRAFVKAKAWGKIDTTRYGNRIHEAGLPATIRPYNARHTGAIAAVLAGVPMSKVSDQLGHASIDTTKNFYTGFVRDTQREVATKTGSRLLDVFSPRLVRKK